MDLYALLKLLHVHGATVLFGTGLGIAFFMLAAHRTGDAAAVAHAAGAVVLADFLFTATAVVAQPITGAALAYMAGYSLLDDWIALSLALYVFTGACWLPVVWLQMRMRDLAVAAARAGRPLPPRYHAYFRAWFALGWPAFTAVIAIFWLMLVKPSLWS